MDKAPSPPRPPLPSPSSARGKFLHNTYNISTAAHRSSQATSEASASPRHGFPVVRPPEWTSEEHARFVLALERFGAARAMSAHAAWHEIAAAVRSRTVADVKAHAAQYLALLQGPSEMPGRGDKEWTAAQDAAFEQLLAVYSSVLTGYPWAEMAALVPEKTPQELQRRYFQLCDDISRIERDGALDVADEGSSARRKPPRKRSACGGASDGPPTKVMARRQSDPLLPALLSPLIASSVSFSFPPLPSPLTPRLGGLSAAKGGEAASEMTRSPSPTSRPAPTPTWASHPSPMFFPPPPSPFGLTPSSAGSTSTTAATAASSRPPQTLSSPPSRQDSASPFFYS